MTAPKSAPKRTHLAVRTNGPRYKGACSNGNVTGKPRVTHDVAEVTCGICKITAEYAIALEASRGH
jgi:hypothetical protein